jgi:hypothetical protein
MNNEGNPMNYALFAGDYYYPRGGLNDLVGQYETIEEAEAAVGERIVEWYHIVYLPTLVVVKSS